MKADTTGQAPFRQGLWYEQFEIGATFWSPGRTVTEADLVAFSGLSWDLTGLHTDEVAAARSPFRTRVAHGFLIGSMTSGLGVQIGIFDGTIDALMGVDMNFVAPTFPGDTIRVCLTVREKEDRSKRNGKVIFDVLAVNQEGKHVLEGEWRTLVRRDRRPPTEEA